MAELGPDTEQVERLVLRIMLLLAGHSPGQQGSVLAELLSLFIVGHHPAIRDDIMELHLRAVRDLIPLTEMEMFPNGLPDGWTKQ
jgi:hypothetical protein